MALTSQGLTPFAKARILNYLQPRLNSMILVLGDTTQIKETCSFTSATTSSLSINLSSQVVFDNLNSGDVIDKIILNYDSGSGDNSIETFEITPDYTLTEDGKVRVVSASYTLNEL